MIMPIRYFSKKKNQNVDFSKKHPTQLTRPTCMAHAAHTTMWVKIVPHITWTNAHVTQVKKNQFLARSRHTLV